MFRLMNLADVDRICQLENKLNPSPWSKANFERYVEKGCAWVVEKQQQVVGYCVMTSIFGEAELLLIAIDESAQRQGLAFELFNHCLSELDDIISVFLEVRVSNAKAIALYHKLGFNEMDVRKNYYRTENGQEDALLMRLETAL